MERPVLYISPVYFLPTNTEPNSRLAPIFSEIINFPLGVQFEPVKDFFKRYGMNVSILFLAIIGLYRVSDIVLGVVANIFYQDMGFSKVEIAAASKTFGLFMTISGGFFGGILAIRIGIYKVFFLE